MFDDRSAVNSAVDDINSETQCCFRWTIAKSRKGRKGTHKSALSGVTELAQNYRQQLTDNDKTVREKLNTLKDSTKDPQLTAVRTAISQFM